MQQIHIFWKRVKSNRSKVDWECIGARLCVQVEKEHVKSFFWLGTHW